MSVKVCVLTQEEADTWKNTGIKPLCIAHRHVALSTAIRWREYPRCNCIVKVEWAGKNALMVEFEEAPRMLQTKSSGGVAVLQLVPGPTAHIVGVKCWCGSTHKRQNGIPATGARDRRYRVNDINLEVEDAKRKQLADQ